MASAKPGVHHVQLKPNSVPQSMVQGAKFLMWNENTSAGTPVTLRVDEKGTILFWKEMNKEMDFLDIALIRDTRTGKFCKVPKDGKLRESLNIGPKECPLEDKSVSVAYGTDMINIDWINFVCSDKETAQLWTNELLKYSVNLLSANFSTLSFLEKWYTRVISIVDTDGKIPVKNVVKQVASHRDDKRKVEQALDTAGLLKEKADALDPTKLTFQNFFTFYLQLLGRIEVDMIFEMLGARKKPYISATQFKEFLNEQQRDPRLNEILYPFATVKHAQEIIDLHESKSAMAAKEKGCLSKEGFLRFLMSDENNVIPADKLDLSEDMNQPLAHYFINSSHNTYLTGHQFTGKSSVEIYRQVLLSGCRCIELDCWDGKGQDEEPMITHGYTMCTEVPFKDVIEAIAESAFKTSDYPVILSFENHCGPRQQVKMANYCRAIFGEMLLDAMLDSHPLKPDVPLPSPQLMKRRIIVKNKKKHVHKGENPAVHKSATSKSTKGSKTAASEIPNDGGAAAAASAAGMEGGEGDGAASASMSPTTPSSRKISSDFSPGGLDKSALEVDLSMIPEMGFDSDSDSSDSEDEGSAVVISEEELKRRERMKRDKGTAGKEAEAAQEMSALVIYVQPIHFHSFESSEKRKRSYEISSFVESQATALLKESPVEFVNYNKRQLSRIYPRGTRVDSSNFLPQVFWNAGCQLVALNFQTLDLAMQINLGIFEYNGRSGYILKPDFMRRSDRRFDPFAESTVDGIVAGTVGIKVISGQFLSDKRVGTFVEVDMYGLPTDTVRKKFRTKTIPNNGLCPLYDEDPFIFKKVVLPNLALIRIGVYEESGKLIGHRIMPVEGLRPGYRHIPLRNECNQAIMLPTIFVHIVINDYVPDEMARYADALLNPIAYVSGIDRHAHQLEILTEDFESDEELSDDDDLLSKSSTTKAAVKDLGDKMQQRQNSLNSRPKGVDMSPTGENKGLPQSRSLNRMGSSQHMVISKQESSQSAGSSGSVGNLNRMTSQGMMGENAQKSKLNDSAILTPTPLEELKNCKAFQKAVAKLDKELESMRRKHDKQREVTEEQHQQQLDKLIASQTRARINLEKTHTKTLKKLAKVGENTELKQQAFKGELQVLLQQQEEQHREMKYKHSEVMLNMGRGHLEAELEISKRGHGAIYDVLTEVMTANHNCHKKALEEIHDRDVVDLKKAMDPQIREHMKTLAKKHKDKQELSRIKREAQTKHVGLVVTERQRLRDLLSRRKGDLEGRLEEIRKQVERDRNETLNKYEDDFEEKCRKLQRVFDTEVNAFGDEEDDNENENDAGDVNCDNDSSAPVNGMTESNEGSAGENLSAGENVSAGETVSAGENGLAVDVDEGSPKHVSTIIVNRVDSPVKDVPVLSDNKDSEEAVPVAEGHATEVEGEEKGNLDEKVNSKEELTTM